MSVPSLRRICVKKIVKEIKHFVSGVEFEDLGNYRYILGPFEHLSSRSISTIFEYVIVTRQLNPGWLSVLIVTHLRTVDFSAFPSGVNPALFKMLNNRCKALEKLIIPNCKRIPNKTLCELLVKNPSLLEIDISNKVSPKVDMSVVNTIAQSCHFLRVLKLSDYRVEDPKSLLVLCGKKVCNHSLPEHGESARNVDSSLAVASSSSEVCTCTCAHNGSSVHDPSSCAYACVARQNGQLSRIEQDIISKLPEKLSEFETTSSGHGLPIEPSVMDCGGVGVSGSSNENSSVRLHLSSIQVVSGLMDEVCVQESLVNMFPTREEQENQRGGSAHGGDVDSSESASRGTECSDEDLYENDDPISPLNVENLSAECGCLELETLWLDNVNLTDPVAAVLLQSLPKLRDLNLSDTDICNPWRLLDSKKSTHLRLMRELDVKSTALSRTALELIPRFHPDLQKFSISSTTLPPHTYTNIGKLTGVAELELIGGQFYPCEPQEIFEIGVSPAICAIGVHLCSLNLTYFAHVKFEIIAQSCPKLEHLDLSHTNVSCTYPCSSLSECCPFLVTLNLAFSHIDVICVNKNESINPGKALEKMIGQPQNINELLLGGLSVTDESIRNIFPCPIQSLKSLNMSKCCLVTIAGVQHIWNKCLQLRKIDITHCREISLAEFQMFEKQCQQERPVFKLEGSVLWK